MAQQTASRLDIRILNIASELQRAAEELCGQPGQEASDLSQRLWQEAERVAELAAEIALATGGPDVEYEGGLFSEEVRRRIEEGRAAAERALAAFQRATERVL